MLTLLREVSAVSARCVDKALLPVRQQSTAVRPLQLLEARSQSCSNGAKQPGALRSLRVHRFVLSTVPTYQTAHRSVRAHRVRSYAQQITVVHRKRSVALSTTRIQSVSRKATCQAASLSVLHYSCSRSISSM